MLNGRFADCNDFSDQQMIPVLVGLGSNLGLKDENLTLAWQKIGEIPGVDILAISRYYVTDPVGGPLGQEKFLNAAGFLKTFLSPEQLLEKFHEIEADLGRTREERWGPRTIDLDLLLYGTEEVANKKVVIPHPRMAERRFVLAPAMEIAGDFPVGKSEKTIDDLFCDLAASDKEP